MCPRKYFVTAVAMIVALATAACAESDGKVSDARPVGDNSSSGAAGGQLEVPQVQQPLDVSRFVDDPCKLDAPAYR